MNEPEKFFILIYFFIYIFLRVKASRWLSCWDLRVRRESVLVFLRWRCALRIHEQQQLDLGGENLENAREKEKETSVSVEGEKEAVVVSAVGFLKEEQKKRSCKEFWRQLLLKIEQFPASDRDRSVASSPSKKQWPIRAF